MLGTVETNSHPPPPRDPRDRRTMQQAQQAQAPLGGLAGLALEKGGKKIGDFLHILHIVQPCATLQFGYYRTRYSGAIHLNLVDSGALQPKEQRHLHIWPALEPQIG